MYLLEEYTNGNHKVQIYSDGTKIKETINLKDTHFTYDFAENIDIKINNRCDGGCVYCHENSTPSGQVPSLISVMNEKWFQTLKKGQELAIGGGNIFESLDLEVFLKALREKGVIANITINQKHLYSNHRLILSWICKKLIRGIGISLVNSKDPYLQQVLYLFDRLGVDNVVIHTIAGILNSEDLPILKDRKVLILGYKDLRRGHTNLYTNGSKIRDNLEWLKKNLSQITKDFKLCSFDCLGIQQLQPKERLNKTDKEWNTIFQGSDTDVYDKDGNITCSTFYIDLVNRQVARMSTADINKRYTIEPTDDIESLFKKSTQDWGNENGLL